MKETTTWELSSPTFINNIQTHVLNVCNSLPFKLSLVSTIIPNFSSLAFHNREMGEEKMKWKCIIPRCYKTKDHVDVVGPKKEVVSKQSSFQRLSISDVSDPSSPMFADDLSNSLIGSKLHVFSLAELKDVTHSFSRSNLLGEGGFGPVYKGFIDDKLRPGLAAQPVAVKLLDLYGLQGHNEWLVCNIFCYHVFFFFFKVVQLNS